MDDDLKKPSGAWSQLRYRLALNWRLIFGLILPFALLPLALLEDNEMIDHNGTLKKSTKFKAAYSILLVALYWMFEVMPLAVTSLLPLVLFPFWGILDTEEVAPAYFKETNVMFFGGLVLALAVEYCNLHRRIALKVMSVVGSSPIRLLFGVMFTSAFLSMWMSNTACTAMMLPILIAVLDQLAGSQDAPKKDDDLIEGDHKRYSISHAPSETPVTITVPDSETKYAVVNRTQSSEELRKQEKKWEGIRRMYLLGVAYACNLGGTATITGTGPNLVFQDAIKAVDVGQGGKYLDMTFANWMGLNVPAMILNVLLAFLYLLFKFYGIPNWRYWPLISLCVKPAEESEEDKDQQKRIEKADKLLKTEYTNLGPIRFHEVGVFVVFVFVIVLWIFRDPKFMKGWNNVLEAADIGDATAAILGITLMFLIPRDMTFITGTPKPGQAYEALLDWKFVQHHLSWGVVLLLGGGFALSDGAMKSGLSEWLGEQLAELDSLNRALILLIVMVMTAAITEVCSNVATANVLLPILITLSKTLNIHPLYLTVPATISCSFAFMLPVATPPNALVFAAGNLRIIDMVSAGFFLNVSCVVVYFLVQISYGELFFGYSSYEYPPDSMAASRLLGGGLIS